MSKSYGVFEDISEIEAYSIKELTRFFSEFQKGIEEINRVEKKFKRKKYNLIEEDKKMITMCRDHLINKENEYYEMLIDLITSDDEEDKQYFRDELTFFVHNKYGVMNEFLKWELDIKEEQEK